MRKFHANCSRRAVIKSARLLKTAPQQCLIKADQHTTVTEVLEELGISFGTMRVLTKNDLGFGEIAETLKPA
ncbi:hypothetical protein Trydic_g13753 [Trypoxylus dichotomus]